MRVIPKRQIRHGGGVGHTWSPDYVAHPPEAFHQFGAVAGKVMVFSIFAYLFLQEQATLNYHKSQDKLKLDRENAN